MTYKRQLYKRYLLGMGCMLAGGIAAVVALGVVVDPYRLYRVVDLPGFNAVKPGLTRYQQEIKVAQAVAQRPAAVILGNSRAEIGFDPATLGRLAGGVPAYNLAIPGASLESAIPQLRALHEAGIRPRTMVVGAEFLDFVAQRNSKPAPPPAARNAALWALQWRFDALFSLQTLGDAADTLRIQRAPEALTMTPQGFNPLLEYRGHVRREGQFPMFEQRAQDYAQRFSHKLQPALTERAMAALDQVLRLGAQTNADVRLVVYPYHAQINAMLEHAGLWPVFEQWKQQVLARVAEVRREYPQARITLVDFSGYSAYNCEPIPMPGDLRSQTRWYWEAGHFKKELGDLVLEQVMAGPASGTGFGMWLEPGDEGLNRQRIAAEKLRCKGENLALFEHVDKLMKKLN